MNNLKRSTISKSRSNIKFLTSMFYITLNNRSMNQAFASMLLSEFLILNVAGIPSRDVIGWHDC